jgi:hypothetical protein
MRSPIPELGDTDNQEQQRNLDRHLSNCVFVCHSSRDSEFIEKNIETFLDQSLSIATYTQEDGAWFYPYGIFCFDYARTKEMYRSLVNTALRQCAAFVVVVSKNAANSEWVRKEILYSSKHFDQILAIQIDDMSFAQFRTSLGLPEAFAGSDQLLSVQVRYGVPNEISHLLAVATHYFKLKYITPSGIRRPLGSRISR